MRASGLVIYQKKLRLYSRKNFFSERAVKYWNRVPREIVESASLQLFKKCVDVVLKHMVSRHGGDRLAVGP